MRQLMSASIVVACFVFAFVCDAAEDQRNAADLYREAFKTMRSLPVELTAALHEEGDDGFRALSDNQIKLVGSTAELSRLLDEAQKVERCEWDESFFKNPMAVQTPGWLGDARRVTYLACLRDRHQRQVNGNTNEGVEEVIRAWTMGRRISRGSTLINGVVQISIDAQFMEHLAARLPSMSRAEVEHLLRRMDSLPNADTLKEAAQREMKAVIRWFREELPKDVDKCITQWVDMKKQLHDLYKVINGNDAEFDPLPYRAVRVVAKTDAKRYQAMVDEFEMASQGHLKIFDVPLDRIDATFEEWKKGVNRDNQLIKEITVDDFGVFKHLPRTAHRIIVMHAMFRAGAAYLADGEAALAKHKEPGTGETFRIEKDEKGFTLLSRRYTDGESTPWSLRFGPRMKKP